MIQPTSQCLVLYVPFPPSVNTYWGFQGSRRFLTKRAVEFKKMVTNAYKATKHAGFQKDRLSIGIQLFAPDRRLRDIDNHVKSLLDALCQAGAFDDDSQIDELLIVRKQIIKDGQGIVTIKSLD